MQKKWTKNRRDQKRQKYRGKRKKRRKSQREQLYYRRGKARSTKGKTQKVRVKARYGCGEKVAQKVCQAGGVMGHRERGRRKRKERGRREEWRKSNSRRGVERKRKEREARQKQTKRGTVRGRKRKMGLPVRGQRTSTNAKTARKRNGQRRTANF